MAFGEDENNTAKLRHASDMIVTEKRPLQEECDGDGQARVGEDCEYCVIRDAANSPVQLCSEAAVWNVGHYLSNTYEYMVTERLAYEHVVCNQNSVV